MAFPKRAERFLLSLGMCEQGIREVAKKHKSIEAAWRSASACEKWDVMAGSGMRHTESVCPACNYNAPANHTIPAAVRRAYRRFKG